MSSIYNLDKLVKIEVVGERKDTWYSYKTKLTFLGLTTRKAGIYEPFGFVSSILDFNEENLFMRDNIVYVKPKCILRYVSGYANTYYFNTLKEAEDFRDEIRTRTGYSKWIE
jgi:hypothetical protein